CLSPSDRIRPGTYRNGSLRVFPHRDTGNSRAGSFFLDSPRVGDYQGGMLHQTEKVKIPKRFEDVNPFLWRSTLRTARLRFSIIEFEERLKPEFGDPLPSSVPVGANLRYLVRSGQRDRSYLLVCGGLARLEDGGSRRV